MPTMQLHLAHHPSPIGTLLIATDAQARLRALDFDDRETEMHTWLRLHYGSFELTPGPAPAAIIASVTSMQREGVFARTMTLTVDGGM